ncbi:MBL fold metallo-hydrolase [Cohnella nanjingensis]|uniref:MBL fold metallo-hydrolase n=1 Tax=Cohnella nanjingensis TaxID=1387779 RepID=A0A7X0RNH9_9BACL|nr:MBL fold metallo-hydrolase [Cohnella nanjingensis]MBB6670784.1 MBL fold metallo-hydrolase [Cohnella nanjingensis]
MRTSIVEQLRTKELARGQMAICSLGQAGFILKADDGTFAIIDPYFSDYCEQTIGYSFKRLMPCLVEPEEVDEIGLSAYLITHPHEDHFDPIGIRAMRDTAFPFFAPSSVVNQLGELGIGGDRCHPLRIGDEASAGGWRFEAIFADHGELAPDAVGFIIRASGRTICHMGDTCFNAEEWAKLNRRFDINLLILPINGKFGNMNEAEAADTVALVAPKKAIPCHFWMLPGNSGGDVLEFLRLAETRAPETDVLLLTQGEIYVLE